MSAFGGKADIRKCGGDAASGRTSERISIWVARPSKEISGMGPISGDWALTRGRFRGLGQRAE
jgi:hypothetical protein